MSDKGFLVSFLRRFTTKENETITHTRIGNIGSGGNIYPDKYSIPIDKYDEFLKSYNKKLLKIKSFLKDLSFSFQILYHLIYHFYLILIVFQYMK